MKQEISYTFVFLLFFLCFFLIVIKGYQIFLALTYEFVLICMTSMVQLLIFYKGWLCWEKWVAWLFV